MDRVAVFDLKGPYAHYRKNYSPVSPVTFPCPTPTAAIGTIAGIIGLEKREYLERFASDHWRLAISLQNPVRKYRAAINLINTKLDPKTFRPKGKSPRIQIPFEFLKDVSFRIHFWHANEELFLKVTNQLKKGTTIYTPSLGLAQCIADVEFVGLQAVEQITAPNSKGVLFDSVVPLSNETKLFYDEGKRYQRFTVPVSMHSGRLVKKYQEAVVEEDANSICVSGATPYRCGDATVAFFEGNE